MAKVAQNGEISYNNSNTQQHSSSALHIIRLLSIRSA